MSEHACAVAKEDSSPVKMTGNCGMSKIASLVLQHNVAHDNPLRSSSLLEGKGVCIQWNGNGGMVEWWFIHFCLLAYILWLSYSFSPANSVNKMRCMCCT